MPKLNITKSIHINKDKATVLKFLSNFNNWQSWSPWLITEPDAEVKIQGDGQYYSWNGKRVGSGEMTIKTINDSKIDYDLTFLKPWKSKAKTSFTVEDLTEGTKVSWHMDSSLPFFLFFMKRKTEAFIGMDYDRGLKMLKEQLEQGSVSSKLSFLGESTFEGCSFVGIKRTVNLDMMPKFMAKDFGDLMTFSKQENLSDSQLWFTQYHKFDMVKNKVSYTACIGVPNQPKNINSGWVYNSLPTCKMHTVRHQGPYEYSGNAWSASQMMIRSKEIKPKKGIPPIEFYRNSPQEVKPKELISDICFFVK